MNKKKAKILVIGTRYFYLGDAASGKSTLIQSYAKKNYQFTSDYNMVCICFYVDARSRHLLQDYLIAGTKLECGVVSV